MSEQEAITIPAMYNEINHVTTNGVAGYQIEKKYFDPLKAIEDRENINKRKGQKGRRHVIKRGNYLEDEAKIHKEVPGPGKYTTQQEWPTKSKMKIQYPDRKTYFSQIMKEEKRNKKPAPGAYNLVKTQKEVEAEKKRLASKKIKEQDRTSYLDGIQYESSIRPGVGNYNPRVPVQSFRTESKLRDRRSRPSQNSGVRSISSRPKRSRASHQTRHLTTPTRPSPHSTT